MAGVNPTLDAAKSKVADAVIVSAAKTLAMTALDLLAQPDELRKAKAEFASTAG